MVHVLTVPYDSGRRDARMGRGPAALLGALPPGSVVEPLDHGGEFRAEAASLFALAGRVADRVRAAADAGALPLILSGNCLPAAVGSAAGVRGRAAVAWLDAHGDFHTPETTPSGFVDGMALAAAAGQCWRPLAAGVPGFRPVPAGSVVHVGGRDFDPGERERLAAFGAAVAAAPPAAPRLPAGADGWYLHVDLDVLDPREVPANGYQPAGGLAVAEVADFIRRLRAAGPVLAAGLTAYDPGGDPDRRAAPAAAALVAALTS